MNFPKKGFVVLFLLVCAAVLAPLFAYGQELHEDLQGIWRAEVVEVLSQEMRLIPGTDTEHIYQTLQVKVLEGPKEGEIVIIENDYLKLKEGNKFFMNYLILVDGTEFYSVHDLDRRGTIFVAILLFVLVVIVFGGWQGVRSLFALIGSFAAIFYVLMPGLIGGWNPLVASFLVAGGILFAAIFFTHGFNRESVIAFGGTMVAVVLTGILAIFAVDMAGLSGFASDESIYLNFNTAGTLDFRGLLLGAIIIGVLGVLDDIAITQAAVVGELYGADPNMSKNQAYKRAIRVGKEHVGALVNTLVLAYTGASLPLLLFFYLSPAGLMTVINTEIIATEIVRTIVGSIGLIATVPLVTILAAIFLKGHPSKGGHIHSHSHGHIDKG